jgi:hypothetical protein
VHRGRANEDEERRPVLYLTSCRSWFRDAQNFPDERLLQRGPSSGGGAGFGGAAKPAAKKPAKGKAGKKRK